MTSQPIRTALVLTDYEAVYTDPLRGLAGDVLQVGRADPDWPGWVWCTAVDGHTAWTPLSYLDDFGETGHLRRDYDSTELTVSAGEMVTVYEEESGWCWIANADGQFGWVPARCLK